MFNNFNSIMKNHNSILYNKYSCLNKKIHYPSHMYKCTPSIKYNIIAAHCNGFGIGYQNKLPWHYKEDLKYFSNKTIGNGNNAVIMGYNTLMSLPKNYLPNRYNFCLTSKQNLRMKNIHFFNSPENLHKYLHHLNLDYIWVIGGNQIYNYYLNNFFINNLFITHIHKDYNCDTYFPNINNLNRFILTNSIIKKENNTILEFKQYCTRFPSI